MCVKNCINFIQYLYIFKCFMLITLLFFVITFYVDLYRKFGENFAFLCRLLLLITNIVFVESSIKMKKNKIKFLKSKKRQFVMPHCETHFLQLLLFSQMFLRKTCLVLNNLFSYVIQK